MITIQSSYPTSTYIIVPIITFYCGIYLNLSNHYILRPKIEPLLEKLSVSSSLAIQIMVDILSNLSFISYAICSSFLTKPSDQPIRMIQIYTVYWATICLSIIMYMRVPSSMVTSKVIFFKNGFFLVLSFANLIYHYISDTSFITLPVIFIGLYVINILITAYEEKFITVIYQMLNIEQTPIPQSRPKMISHLPTIEHLSQMYPITVQEIDEKMQMIKEKSNSQPMKNFNKNKPLLNKIDTKIIAREKLMRICLCVHLSMMKKEQQEINAVRQYYGVMNGTISDNIIKQKQAGKDDHAYFNNRNKDKKDLANKGTKKDHPSKVLNSVAHQTTDGKMLDNDGQLRDQHLNMDEGDGLESQSFMYYLFPIRIFEFSKIISSVFSILINLGFGILLGYCQSLMNTLYYGQFAELALAALFLPIIPKVSLMEFINTLSLATLWKFAVFGLSALICMTTSSTDESKIIVLNFSMSPYLQYISILTIVLVIMGFVSTVVSRNMWKIMILLFLVSLGAMAWITYVSIVNSNTSTNTN